MVAAAIVEVVRLRQACPSGARRPLIAESAPRACTHRLWTAQSRDNVVAAAARVAGTRLPLELRDAHGPETPFSGPFAERQEHGM